MMRGTMMILGTLMIPGALMMFGTLMLLAGLIMLGAHMVLGQSQEVRAGTLSFCVKHTKKHTTNILQRYNKYTVNTP